MTWTQVYNDNDLKWEKIVAITPHLAFQRFIRSASHHHDEQRLIAMAT